MVDSFMMELNKFLVKAKSATYASEGEGSERILLNEREVYKLVYHGGFIDRK